LGEIAARVLAEGRDPPPALVIRKALVLGAVALVLGAPAAGAPRWSAPVQISSGVRAVGPELALNSAGAGLVVWDEEVGTDCTRDPASLFCTHIVQAARRAAGSATWEPPLELSRPGVGSEPRGAIGPAGDATVAWIHDIGDNRVLQATYRRSLPGSFPEPSDVSEVVRAVRSHRVGLDERGNAVLAWAERPLAQELFDVVVATRSAASGVWSGKTRLSSLTGRSAAGPELAVAPNGLALVAWTETDGTVRVAGGNIESGTWQAPVDVGRGARATAGLHVAMNSAGDAAVVWVGQTGAPDEVRAAFRPRGEAWGQPASLGAGRPGSLPTPRVAITSASRVVAAWLGAGGVTASTRTATGTWAASPVPGSTTASTVQLALGDSGNAVTAWTRGSDGSVEASLRPAGIGEWLPPSPVSAPRASRVGLALDEAERAVAVWGREDGQRLVVEAADLDPDGPVLAQLVVPPQPLVVGRRGRFSVRPAPWAAPLAGPPRWTFGDGTSATGKSVSHAFARAGPFRVTVTQSDERGAASRAGATVRVVAPVRNVERPRIEGQTLVGSTLLCRRGRWSGSGPIRYAYSWRSDGRRVPGATGRRFRLRTRDRGSLVACVIVATNPASSARAASDRVSVH
jgi:hypothetical protein